MCFNQTHSVHSNDADIRGPLVSWLASQHEHDGTTGIVQELQIPRPSGRIDVAVVNGEISGFEIKSDADTLSRLKTQIFSFSVYFDRVNIVITERHLQKTLEMVPKWWGIILFDREEKFSTIRESEKNKNIKITSLLYSLSKAELLYILKDMGLPFRRSDKKRNLIEIFENTADSEKIHNRIRHIIRCRKKTVILDSSFV